MTSQLAGIPIAQVCRFDGGRMFIIKIITLGVFFYQINMGLNS